MKLKDKVVVITGGTKGLGRSVVEYLSYEGAKVVTCGRGINVPPDMINIKNVYYKQCDIKNEKSICEFLGYIKKKFLSVDILINNAAEPLFGDLLKFEYESICNNINANLIAPINFTKEVCQIMMCRNNENTSVNGIIINIGSKSHKTLIDGNYIYSTCKVGLKIFTEHLWEFYKSSNIKATYISIDRMKTNFSSRTIRHSDIKILPDEVAKVIVEFLIMCYKYKSFHIPFYEIDTSYKFND